MAKLPISVLTLVKQRRPPLRHLLESLARMAEPPAELIVVNMDREALRLPPLPFRATVLAAPSPGLPLGHARNLAASHASARYLCFLDVDCVVSARSLAHALSALAREPCLVAPEMRYLPAGQPVANWQEANLLALGRPHPARAFPPVGAVREPNPGFLWSVAFLIPAARFYDLGGFDPAFTGYGAEDTDFGFRAALSGLPLILLGGQPIFHQHHTLYAPPLPHFADIVRNASLFHRRYGLWPMRDRLTAFEAAGLITQFPDHVVIHRYPSAAEILAARQADSLLF